ncbi:hypothetical protein [Parasitella parasitica]|uniref:Uncharacterized protein n=1 Tax=Parasitella parasitica TaxID=35722 RepID=A0A0B7N097_9FUNG|nr:hypothetical protein [Parasitella parasitica]
MIEPKSTWEQTMSKKEEMKSAISLMRDTSLLLPATQRVEIHREGDHLVYFHDNDTPQEVVDKMLPDSTLTACLKYNRHKPQDLKTRATLYPDFCERYTYHNEHNLCSRRPRRSGFGGMIGRVYTVSQKNIEKFHLRILLYHVPGETSFADFRTQHGQVYPSYQAVKRAMGFLRDDNE